MKYKLTTLLLTFTLIACSSSPDPEPADEPAERPSAAADVYATTGEADRPSTPPSELPDDPELIDDVDDELLDLFGDSLRALYDLERQLEAEENTYYHRVAEADTAGEVQQIQQQYMNEMEDAVHERGMNFNDFLTLGEVVVDDEVLMEELLTRVDEAKVEEFFGL